MPLTEDELKRMGKYCEYLFPHGKLDSLLRDEKDDLSKLLLKWLRQEGENLCPYMVNLQKFCADGFCEECQVLQDFKKKYGVRLPITDGGITMPENKERMLRIKINDLEGILQQTGYIKETELINHVKLDMVDEKYVLVIALIKKKE